MFFKKFLFCIPVLIVIFFFIVFSLLTIVRHNHYQSFGYDLAINDQVVWKYSKLQLPLTTIDPFPTKTKFAEHVELVYALISPSYWIYSSPITLLIVRNGWFCFSALAVFLIARKKKINKLLSLSLMFCYLAFYGVQNAIWTDVHSNSFAAAFLIWFIYFLETKQKKLAILFFFFAITAKENVGLSTFFVSILYFSKDRSKLLLFFILMSVAYVIFIFLIFFPHIMHVQYLYANSKGIFSNLNPFSLIDTAGKREVIWYSLFSFGFLALLNPRYLLPSLANLAMYFIIASDLPGAQGLDGHYRIGLSVLIVFATIYSIAKHKWLNKWYVGLYLIICIVLVQYFLHLPLSYLFKHSFWSEPAAVKNINLVIKNYLPNNASVVSQNNITPHISERDKVYTLYPTVKSFSKHSPCNSSVCDWFRWDMNPKFLIVDTSSDWDARHFLIDRQNFMNGLNNLEKERIIGKYKQIGKAYLYKVLKNPN